MIASVLLAVAVAVAQEAESSASEPFPLDAEWKEWAVARLRAEWAAASTEDERAALRDILSLTHLGRTRGQEGRDLPARRFAPEDPDRLTRGEGRVTHGSYELVWSERASATPQPGVVGQVTPDEEPGDGPRLEIRLRGPDGSNGAFEFRGVGLASAAWVESRDGVEVQFTLTDGRAFQFRFARAEVRPEPPRDR